MKIQELRLLACGPFNDFTLDLSGGDRGLHLIYGPNEAGKSSALRAITYLCFGFPVQLTDDFLHPYASLRVGARFRNDLGEEIDFVRRKTNKHSLRSRDDATLVADDELRRFLGDIDQVRFKQFFGIDHTMLVNGGKEIVEGGGETGRILFSAGGANDLKKVLDGLENDAQQLFLPGARANRKLNELFSELTRARKALSDHQLPAREWHDHQTALKRALDRKKTADGALQEKSRDKSRLERIQKALPLIAELIDLRENLSQLSEVVLLPSDFSKRRQYATEELRSAEDARKRASSKFDELAQQLDELAIPQPLLEQRTEIESLSERLGVLRQAQKDRPGLEADARQSEDNALDILRKLGASLDLAAADALQLPEVKRRRIQKLGEQYLGIVKDVDAWNSALTELTPLVEENAAEIASLQDVQDVGPLSMAVQDALKLGAIEEELSTSRRDCESLFNHISIGLKRQPLWSGSVEELESLQVPLSETVDRFDDELESLDKEKQDVDRQSNDYQTKAGELNEKLEALRLEFDLPTEANLHSARQQREHGWQLIRMALSTGNQASESAHKFVAAVGEGDDLASAFEHSVKTSDQIVDRLRREADRVAAQAQLLAQQEECVKRIASAVARQQSIAVRREAKLVEWTRIWQPICSAPLPPPEMRYWSRQHAELVRQVQELRQKRDRIQQLQRRIEDRRNGLMECLVGFGVASIPTDATLQRLVDIAQQKLADDARTAQCHRDLSGESVRLEKERKKANDRLTAARSMLLSWQEAWSEAIAELPLAAAGGPSEANVVLELMAQLSQQLRDARGKRHQISQIDRYAEEFAKDVRAIAVQAGSKPMETPVALVAADLVARLRSAVAADDTRTLLLNQLADEQEQRVAASERIDKMQLQLAALCFEAKCASAGDLLGAEERSDRRRNLERDARGLESRLRDLSAGLPLADFIADARGIDADTLEPRIRSLNDDVTLLNYELMEELGPKIGSEKHALELIDSNANAADAAEHVQDTVFQIAIASQEYARLRIALVALRKGIERYRQRHQGPIIQRSSELFSRLTLGAFSGLREDYDSDGKPELVAVRAADDRTVRVAEMSDGTADQLFLAVRLAWLGEYLDSHPAIPFIVDDILIQFDDERSAATLQVLAELSTRTQVILFTHHRHVVDIAQTAIDGDTLFVHELPMSARNVGSATVAG